MKRGLDWYRRKPVEYLGGVQGLTAKQHAVYSVVIDFIYMYGGSVNNDPALIAGYIKDMGTAACRTAINDLVLRDKLQIDGDQLTNKAAKTESDRTRKQNETNSVSGQKGGKKSAEIRARANENSNLGQATASFEFEAIREDNIEKESKDKSLPKKTNKASTDKPAKKTGTRIPENWILSDAEIEFAQSKGMSRDTIDNEAGKFKDYWSARSGAAATKLDWPATWRYWVRNNYGNNNARGRQVGSGFMEGARRAAHNVGDRAPVGYDRD